MVERDYFEWLVISSQKKRRDSNTYYSTRGPPASIYGFSCNSAREVGLFFCPHRTTAAGTATDTKKQTFTINNKFNL